MAGADDSPVVVLTLAPAAGFRGDPYQRLKRWLKLGRRVFGWRALGGELLPPPLSPPAAGGEAFHEEADQQR
jgi:hypothetical protein